MNPSMKMAALAALFVSSAASAQTSDRWRTQTDATVPANDAAPQVTKDQWPSEILRRPLTLAQGLAQISLPLTFNLSNNAVGQPVYIPAIVAFGVTDALTLSLTHQTGLCLSGTSNGCPKFYNDLGLQGMYALSSRGDVQVAAVAGLQAASLSDPFAPAAIVGFDSRYTTGMWAIRLDPRLAIGLSGRDTPTVNSSPVPVALDFHGAPIIGGNRETLFIPVALQLQPAQNLALTLGSGVAMQLDPVVGSTGDWTSIPLGISAAYTMSRVDVGASFGFPNLRGSNGISATDARVGQIFASLRL